MKDFIRKIFGGLNITWPKLIIFSVIMGIYTAIVAMFAPDGSSFHDISVTPEWWILPAIIIIVNAKKPLEAGLKTFVFFLISQPLVYLIQVPFSNMGWGLFGYYPYWLGITVLTLPGAYVGWYIKKDKWYSGIILAVMTVLLVILGVGFARNCIENPPNHLVTTIYCFGMIPLLILAILRSKLPRMIAATATLIALVVCIVFGFAESYEAYNNTFIGENDITFVGEPYISFWTGDGKGGVDIIKYDGGYNFKLTGVVGKTYRFSISDDETEYEFEYYYDKELDTVVVKKK